MEKSQGSSDLINRNVLNDMIRMLRTQQAKLKSLSKSKKLLHKTTKLEYDRCVYDVNRFQHEIAQMMSEYMEQETQHMVEVPRADSNAEISDSESCNFSDGYYNYVSRKCSTQKVCRRLKRKRDEASDTSSTSDNFSMFE